jgi:cytoskeleton protein RodZ
MVKNLWKLDGGVHDDAHDEARHEIREPSAPLDDHYQTVGATLRARREERGEDLRYVAQILRIRYPYLKALEDGRPDELPGPTYAIGFVRTYADHLGLESDRLVQRFKAEAEGLHTRADLNFPAPLPEGKIPSGAVLVVAVVLAALVYGAWIYLSSRDQQVAENAPKLPNRISEIINGKSTAPGMTPQAAGAITEAPPAVGSDVTTSSPKTEAQTPPAAAEKQASAPAAAPGAPAPKTASADKKAPAPKAASPAQASPSAPAASDTAESSAKPAADKTASAPAAAASTETAESNVAPPPPPAPPKATSDELASREDATQPATTTDTPAEADHGPSKVYGKENSNARIIIYAAADSWVEIRDTRTDELLLTRVLFKGDSYRVPDRPGLTLLTGNAGGLRIDVDGQNVPELGPLGAVRRNVSLNPEALKSGKATASGASSPPSASQPQ